jgi:hypothetical protein
MDPLGFGLENYDTVSTGLGRLSLVAFTEQIETGALIPASALAAPSRACLTQNEAAEEYRGKLLKYRQVGSI